MALACAITHCFCNKGHALKQSSTLGQQCPPAEILESHVVTTHMQQLECMSTHPPSSPHHQARPASNTPQLTPPAPPPPPPGVLHAWSRRCRAARRGAALHAALSSRWGRMQLGLAFSGWRSTARERAEKRALQGRAASWWRNLHLAAAFAGWCGAVLRAAHREGAARQVALVWQKLHVSAAFAAWTGLVEERRRHRWEGWGLGLGTRSRADGGLL